MTISKNQFIPLCMLLAVILVLTPALSSLTVAAPYSSSKGWTGGSIASIQSGDTGKSPTWILSGHWGTNIINKTNQDFNQTYPAKFDASFTMVLLNGSARHSHDISNFSLTDVKDENNTVSYTGLATVTLKAGPMKDVPVEIKGFNNNVISIWFNPTQVDNHFESPIYGIVFNKKDMESNGPMAYKENMTKSNSSSW